MTSKRLLGILAGLIVVPVFAQTSSGPRPAFEVASIKLHVDAGPGRTKLIFGDPASAG